MDVLVQKIDPEILLPSYAKASDAGLDLRSAVDLVLNPSERKLIPTGIALAIPNGFVGLIWDRSGNASKFGVHCLSGVIDSGYRGEIKVVMVNLGQEAFQIHKNDRICQLLIQPVVQGNLKVVEQLDATDRGSGGFGSTGKK